MTNQATPTEPREGDDPGPNDYPEGDDREPNAPPPEPDDHEHGDAEGE